MGAVVLASSVVLRILFQRGTAAALRVPLRFACFPTVSAPRWRRLAVVLAGPLSGLLLAIATVFTILVTEGAGSNALALATHYPAQEGQNFVSELRELARPPADAVGPVGMSRVVERKPDRAQVLASLFARDNVLIAMIGLILLDPWLAAYHLWRR